MNNPVNRLVVVGASAGGVEALRGLLQSLPPDFPAAILIAMHSSNGESRLPRILSRDSKLQALGAKDGSEIVAGTAYVAQPNHHLIVQKTVLRSTAGPRRNGHRPSINALFESAAREWGARTIGVVLSGALDDGTLGLAEIKQAGGMALAQSPQEALFTGMPDSALRNVEVDFCGKVSEIAAWLTDIVQSEHDREFASVKPHEHPTDENIEDIPGEIGTHRDEITGFVCPDCGGVLREEQVGTMARFRCHVGHELSEQALIHAQGEQVENAIWTALRVLEERAHLVRRVVTRAEENGNKSVVSHFQAQNREARAKADILRSVLIGDGRQQSVAALQDDADQVSGNGNSPDERSKPELAEPD